MLTRRQIVAGGAFGSILLAAGCSGQANQTAQTVTQQVVSDVNTVAKALNDALPYMQSLLGSSSAAAVAVAQKVAAIVTAAGQVTITTLQNAANPIVQQMQSDYNSVVTALKGFSLPSVLQEVVTDAGILLPFIEGAVGAFVSGAKRYSAADVAGARARLAAFVAKH